MIDRLPRGWPRGRRLVALAATPLLALMIDAAHARQVVPAKSDMSSSAAGQRVPGTPAGTGQPYWYDGARQRMLEIDASRVADFREGSGRSPGKPLRSRSEREKSVEALPEGVSPVLIDPGSPGSVRALPGGVIVVLKQAPAGASADAREAQARRQLTAAGLQPLRPIDPLMRRWLIESAAGLASLDLANRLHERGEFESVSPNWWKQRALK